MQRKYKLIATQYIDGIANTTTYTYTPAELFAQYSEGYLAEIAVLLARIESSTVVSFYISTTDTTYSIMGV